MRNKRLLRTLSAFCLTMVVAFGFTIPAFAQGSEQAPAAPAEDSTNDSNVTVEETEPAPALTPEGNAALVDDFGGNKQLITPTLGMTQKNQPQIKYTLDFDVTPHQLRHTYITNLLYAGVDPKTVQYLAGHENSKTTMDIYAKVKYNKPEELFGVVNGAFHQAIAE